MNANIISMPKIVYNSSHIARGLQRMAQVIHQRHPNIESIGLVGIHKGGIRLVERVEEQLGLLCGKELNLDKGLLDISFYRDDYTRLSQFPVLNSTQVPFNVDQRRLILIDDVVFTGRTVRAALDSLFGLGRPERIELAVLVDRGHREFPIAPDYVGHTLPTLKDQSVNVILCDDPQKDHATLQNQKYQTQKAS